MSEVSWNKNSRLSVSRPSRKRSTAAHTLSGVPASATTSISTSGSTMTFCPALTLVMAAIWSRNSAAVSNSSRSEASCIRSLRIFRMSFLP